MNCHDFSVFLRLKGSLDFFLIDSPASHRKLIHFLLGGDGHFVYHKRLLLAPQLAVKRPVLDRFGDVGELNVGFGV